MNQSMSENKLGHQEVLCFCVYLKKDPNYHQALLHNPQLSKTACNCQLYPTTTLPPPASARRHCMDPPGKYASYSPEEPVGQILPAATRLLTHSPPFLSSHSLCPVQRKYLALSWHQRSSQNCTFVRQHVPRRRTHRCCIDR